MTVPALRLFGVVMALLLYTSITVAQVQTEITPTEVREIAKDAYIYGVPMVDSYRTMYAFNVEMDEPHGKGRWNTILNIPRVFTPDDIAFVTPNSDTPYSFASLDLRAEPVVITIPKIEKHRYFVFQLMDLYTFNFAYIGSRTTGNDGGHYLIVGPEWKGESPKGIDKVIRAETQLVNVIGRTQLFNLADMKNVKKVQAGYKVQPLSKFLGAASPPAPPDIEWVIPQPPGKERTSLKFFGELAFLLQFANPPHPSEQKLRERFCRIGIVPGKPFDTAALPAEVLAAAKNGMGDGQKEIDLCRAALKGKTDSLFGTREFLKNDFVARATGTQVGIGANSREEALYPILEKDSDGEPLDGGKHRYVIRFAKEALPPVNAFWSLTMYNMPKQQLVKNPINRYLINSSMLPELKFDADGGLTIYIQAESPDKDRKPNWLPAPKGPFMMAMRYYWPKPDLLDGRWTSPAIQRVK